MERAVILGSGGHAKVIFDLLESLNRYEVVAVFDPQRIGTTFMGAPVVGGDDDAAGGIGNDDSHDIRVDEGLEAFVLQA